MDKFERKTSLPKNLELEIDLVLKMEFEHVLDLIKKEGLEESIEAVNSWYNKAEKWAQREFLISTTLKKRMLIINYTRIDFYVAAGDIDGALECLDGANFMADQEGFLDIKDLYKDKESELLKLF
ncbi:MAG: hypothetical protein WCO35_03870 [Candidatus Nomurabacteria bacterium]